MRIVDADRKPHFVRMPAPVVESGVGDEQGDVGCGDARGVVSVAGAGAIRYGR